MVNHCYEGGVITSGEKRKVHSRSCDREGTEYPETQSQESRPHRFRFRAQLAHPLGQPDHQRHRHLGSQQDALRVAQTRREPEPAHEVLQHLRTRCVQREPCHPDP